MELLEALPSEGDKHPLLVNYLNRVKTHRNSEVMLEKILGDYEIESSKALDQSKLLVKIGPMLGLMDSYGPGIGRFG